MDLVVLLVGNMNEETFSRLIDNARTALQNSQSEWGKNYWEGVLVYLLRKSNRLM